MRLILALILSLFTVAPALAGGMPNPGSQAQQHPPGCLMRQGTIVCTRPMTVQGAAVVAPGGTPGDDKVPVGDSATASTWRTLPSCSNAATSKLLYDTSTNSFSCGTDQTGGAGGGTPGGLDTYVQFNDGGTFGGDSGLVYNKTTDVLTLAGDFQPNTNIVFTQGTDETNEIYGLDATGRITIGQTHSTTRVGAYTSLFGNNWANAAQRGGAEFVVDNRNSGTGGFKLFEYDGITFVPRVWLDVVSDDLKLASATSLLWSDTDDATGTATLKLARDTGARLSLGNSAAGFRIYNTRDAAEGDPTNFERLGMRWVSNLMNIGTEAAGTGTVRGLELSSPGSQIFMEATSANAGIANVGTSNNAYWKFSGGDGFFPRLTLYNQVTDASGVGLSIYTDSSSPATGDLVAWFEGWGRDSGGTDNVQYAGFQAGIGSPTNGAETGAMSIFTLQGGTRRYLWETGGAAGIGNFTASDAFIGWNNDTTPNFDSSPSVDTMMCRNAAGEIWMGTTSCSIRGNMVVKNINSPYASPATYAVAGGL